MPKKRTQENFFDELSFAKFNLGFESQLKINFLGLFDKFWDFF